MVTGEMAFMAARLFALESRRQINRVSERLDAAEQTIREMRELVTEHEAEIGTLNTRVRSLEDRCRRQGRRVEIRGRDSSGSSARPPSSSGTSSYGSSVRATLHPVLPGRIGYNTYCRVNLTRLSLPKLQGPRSAHGQS